MDRPRALARVESLLRDRPAVAILGPRQCGKTTLAAVLARRLSRAKTPVTWLDLEDPLDLARLEQPRLTLDAIRGVVVIDEVQRRPDLFPVLRVLIDREPKARRFVLLGSASGDLLRQGAESLAGRIALHELTPFSHFEVRDHARLWLRGGLPPAYLARSDEAAADWSNDYVQTFLERDIPALGLRIPAASLRRFWMMLAHVHGGVLNSSELARGLGISDKTVRHYLDILSATFMVRVLQPWHENIGKRQVRAPKVYLRDSGVLHSLLGLRRRRDVDVHPKVGASWEGFALEATARELEVRPEACFFWATHGGAELDLMLVHHGRRLGFEFKRADAPSVTKSMHVALAELGLHRLFVVYPGDEEFALHERIHALGLSRLADPKAAWRRLARR